MNNDSVIIDKLKTMNLALPPFPLMMNRHLSVYSEEETLSLLYLENKNWYLTLKGKLEVERYEFIRQNPGCNLTVISLIRVLSMLKFKEKALVVVTLKEAIELHLLGWYFEKWDKFGFFEIKEVYGYEKGLVTEEDYFKYVVNAFSLKHRANKYMQYLEQHNKVTDMSAMEYDTECLEFYNRSKSQLSEYEYVISNVDQVALPSDGLGVASCLCIQQDKTYISWEPKKIGQNAYKLGIITSQHPIKDQGYVYCFFYCSQYYSLPMFLGQRFVNWDVATQVFPGYRKSLTCSTNIRSFSVRKYEDKFKKKKKYMIIPSGHAVDFMTKCLLDALRVPDLGLIHSKYIVASTFLGLESFVAGGAFTKEYWREHGVEEQFIASEIRRCKERLLLFPERTFPCRLTSVSGKVRCVRDQFFREYGEGLHVVEQAQWESHFRPYNTTSNAYQEVNGQFIVCTSIPQVMKYVRLRPREQLHYGCDNLKLYLINTYFNDTDKKYYAVYVPEIVSRPVVGELLMV